MKTIKQTRNQNHNGGLAGTAYDFVLEMIVNRELPSGTVIQERKLAGSLGVSRTPMREALGRLEGEGWLVRLTDRLLSVKVVTLNDRANVDTSNCRPAARKASGSTPARIPTTSGAPTSTRTPRSSNDVR